MSTTPEEAKQLQETLEKLRQVIKSLGLDFDKIAGRLRPIQEDATDINGLFKTFNDRLRSSNTETDYLVSNFTRLVGEIKNTSVGTQQTVLGFKNLSSIAQKLSENQAGYNRLSIQEIEKLQVKTKIESDRLFRSKALLEDEHLYLDTTNKSLLLQQKRLDNQLKSNANDENTKKQLKSINDELSKNIQALEKNKSAQETIENVLNHQDASLGELNKALENSLHKSKEFNKIMGLTGATAEGLKTTFNNLGLGSLATTLGLDEALKAAQEKADELLNNKIKNEKIIKDLTEQNNSIQSNINENLKEQVETQKEIDKIKRSFPDIENQLIRQKQLEEEINLANQSREKGLLSIKQIRKGKGGEELKQKQLELDNLNRQQEQEKKLFTEAQNRLSILNDTVKKQQESINKNKEQIKNAEDANKQQSLLNSRTQVLNTYISNLGGNLVKNLKDPLFIVGFLVKQIIDAFKMIDSKTGEFAKNMNMTYSAAAGVAKQANNIANSSGLIGVTTKGILESYQAMGKVLGSNAILNEKDALAMTKFRDIAGVSQETLSSIQKTTLATGGDLEKNVTTMMASAHIAGVTNGVMLNEREILDDISKLSKATLLSMNGMPNKLGEAVATAKSLGMTMEQLDKIAGHLLNFEDSIGAELEAELLTGKKINLERARLAAINNDQVTLAKEIRKQYGDINEFSKMNRLQQEAIAKSVGMSREELAATLVQEKALKTMSKEQSEAAKSAFMARVQQVGLEKAQEEIKKGQLKNMMDSQSMQERFNQTIEKLKEIFVSLVTPLLPVLDVFMLMLKPIGWIAGILGKFSSFLSPVIALMATWKLLTSGVGKGMGKILKSMFSIFSTQSRINISKKLGLITDQQAIAAQKSANVLAKGTVLTENQAAIVKKRSLGSAIATNVQEKIGLAYKSTRNVLETGYNSLKKIGSAIAKSDLIKSIGSAAMRVISSLSSIPVVGWALGLAAAGTVAALGYKFLAGNDVFSPAQGGGGYGKRTLLAPEGAILLNNNDNVIATTNPIKTGDDVKSMAEKPMEIKPAGSIKTKSEVVKNNIQIDYNAIGAAVAAALKTSAPIQVNSVINMDGKKVAEGVGKQATDLGTAQKTSTSKI